MLTNIGKLLMENNNSDLNYLIKYHLFMQSQQITINEPNLHIFLAEKIPFLVTTDDYIQIYSYKVGSKLTIEKSNHLYSMDYITSNGVFYKEFSTVEKLIYHFKALISGAAPEALGFEAESI